MKGVFLLLMSILTLSVPVAASAAPIRPVVYPAEVLKPKAIHMVAGQANEIIIYFEKAAEDLANLGRFGFLRVLLPRDYEPIEAYGFLAGDHLVYDKGEVTYAGRKYEDYRILVNWDPRRMVAAGARFDRVWDSLRLLIRAPEVTQPAVGDRGDDLLVLEVLGFEAGGTAKAIPIELHSFEAGIAPKHYRFGLWTYQLDQVQREPEALAAALAYCGINFISNGSEDEDYRRCFAEYGISIGTEIHHSLFHDPNNPAIDAKGDTLGGSSGLSCSDPQAIIDDGARSLPAIREMEERSGKFAAMIYDFEPNNLVSFSPESISRFKNEFQVSDGALSILRDGLVRDSYSAYLREDPGFREVYSKWTIFRQEQNREVIASIRERLDEACSGSRFEITTNGGPVPEHYRTMALGSLETAYAPYVDAIMPQLYRGYGAIGTAWLIQDLKLYARSFAPLSCEVFPLILVRYQGATIANTPATVRQQIIAVIASGADGVLLYDAQQLDARYWEAIARASREVAKWEDFYKTGRLLADGEFSIEGRSRLATEVSAWPPGTRIQLEGFDCEVFVHGLGDRYLATVLNLKDSGPARVKLRLEGLPRPKVLKVVGDGTCTPQSDALAVEVAQEGVAFVLIGAAD